MATILQLIIYTLPSFQAHVKHKDISNKVKQATWPRRVVDKVSNIEANDHSTTNNGTLRT